MLEVRRSIRLKNYDYSQDGAYFVTICTDNRKRLFGDIRKNSRGTIFCARNDHGDIVDKYWNEIPRHYNNIILDEYVVMPNHIHGILFLGNNMARNNRAQNIVPLHGYQRVVPGSLGAIIRGFKIGVTKWFRKNKDIHKVWQRNYYDHIIRNHDDLSRIREYIKKNPIEWKDDKYYSE